MKLYLRYLSIHIKSQMQYKISFLLTIIGHFLVAFSALLGIYFMMARFNSVAGFSLNEVLLCFATVLFAYTLAECFARGFDRFSNMISNGEFDRIMVRPQNVIFQILGSQVDFTRLGRWLQALIVFAYAIPMSEVVWSPDKIMTLIFMIIGGVIVFSGLFVIYAALCFFTIEGLEFMNIFTDGGKEFGSYPLSIYGEGVLKFFTFVVPIALFQYYPLLYLLDHSDNKLYMFAPLCSFVFIIPCYILWKIGVKHYKSTGS